MQITKSIEHQFKKFWWILNSLLCYYNTLLNAPTTLRLPHFICDYNKYWLQWWPGDSSEMCNCSPWRQSWVTVFCSHVCPSDRFSTDIKIQYKILLAQMHTCLNFVQLSREIYCIFKIETLIIFIFKYHFGNCFKAALKTNLKRDSQSQSTPKNTVISSPWFFNENNTYR